MTAERDVTRIVRSWLEGGVTALPDRVLDRVLDDLPATPQHRSTWSVRRTHRMNAAPKLAIGTAAVIAVLVAGINLLPRDAGGVGGPALVSPRPSAPPTSTPTTAPPPSSAPIVSLDAAPLEKCESTNAVRCIVAGTYRLSSTSSWGGQIAMDVPKGWFSWHPALDFEGVLVDSGPDAPGGSGWGLMFINADLVSVDPCDPTQGTIGFEAGRTVDGVVSALSRWAGFQASEPLPTTVGTYDAQLVELTSTRTVEDCPDAELWRTKDGTALDGYSIIDERPGTYRVQFRIMKFKGRILVIRTTDYSKASPFEVDEGVAKDPGRHTTDQVELHQILDSIQLMNPARTTD
jgi:hypothetical protein